MMRVSNIRRNTRNYQKEDLYLVVEGEVDEIFINKILSFVPSKYNVRVRVANGNGNIPIHVNILKKIYSYSKIMVLYDLDASTTMDDLKRYLKNKQVSLKEEDIFFVNPCIEYLIVLTKEVNNNKFKNKRDYQELFKKYFGINEYSGHIPQVEQIVEQLTITDYNNFLDNLKKVSSNDNILPSTNFLEFLDKIRK
jgi:5S rRNA maturation endonuclease (ribonuclease M5)